MTYASGAVLLETKLTCEAASNIRGEAFPFPTIVRTSGCTRERIVSTETIQMATRRRRQYFGRGSVVPRCWSGSVPELRAEPVRRGEKGSITSTSRLPRRITGRQQVSLSVFSIGSITNIGTSLEPAGRYTVPAGSRPVLPRHHWEGGSGVSGHEKLSKVPHNGERLWYFAHELKTVIGSALLGNAIRGSTHEDPPRESPASYRSAGRTDVKDRWTMATSGHPRGGGRPSKGPRQFVGGKIPTRMAEQVAQAAELEGLTITDFIESALAMRLQHVDLTARDNQEELPIAVAS